MFLIPKPGYHRPGTSVDFPHLANPMVSFFDVPLVYTKCINPQFASILTDRASAKSTYSNLKVPSDRDHLVVDNDILHGCRIWLAPGVGKRCIITPGVPITILGWNMLAQVARIWLGMK